MVFDGPGVDDGRWTSVFTIEKTVRAMVDSRGGIMKDPCLYLRRYEDGHVGSRGFLKLFPNGISHDSVHGRRYRAIDRSVSLTDSR